MVASSYFYLEENWRQPDGLGMAIGRGRGELGGSQRCRPGEQCGGFGRGNGSRDGHAGQEGARGDFQTLVLAAVTVRPLSSHRPCQRSPQLIGCHT